MTPFKDEWLEHRRRRYMRPDASRYLRPDYERYLRPDHARYDGTQPYEPKYSPDQPRVPAGSGRESGQWTQVTGPYSGRGPARYGANFPGATNGQLLRLDRAIARTQDALAQIRQRDPNWQPATSSLTAPGSIDGAIRSAEARAEEAEARLDQLRSGIGGNFGPPLESTTPRAGFGAPSSPPFDGPAWINAYRAANNMPDLFGQATWPNDKGTVAVTEINGSLVFGVNSGAPGYATADRIDANAWRWTLINKYPDVMQSDNIGQAPNNSLYHAEATLLLRAARENSGTLAGHTIEVHVDREMCDNCETVLPLLGIELGNPAVTFINRQTGSAWIVQDGFIRKSK